MEPVHPTYTMPLSKAYVLYAYLSTIGTKLQKTYHYKNVYNRPLFGYKNQAKTNFADFHKIQSTFFN